MAGDIDDRIRQSRTLLQNPYAYLDGDGGYTAVLVGPASNVHDARRVLQNPYAYLDKDGGYSEWPGYRQESKPAAPLIDRDELLQGQPRDKGFSKREIEDIARRFQVELWRRKAEIWPARKDIGPLDVLDPAAALSSLGYSVQLVESLGQYSGTDELFEVAGVLDNDNADVQISRRFSPDIRNFTIAHELAHTVLHSGSGLHRDRALDGASGGSPRNSREAEADLFASYFLLPEKLVRGAFVQRFKTECFSLDDDTAFGLTLKSLDLVQSRCRTARDLARLLAEAEYYHGVRFDSLARQFGVSREAMAIRLEELGLVQR